MNKVQEALLNVLGLEIDQEFEFHNKIYKFISFLSENENNENNINLCLARQDSIDRKWYEYDGNLLSIINNPDKIHLIKKPILDEKEKKYLEDIIKPFKDRIDFISKLRYSEKTFFIIIVVNKEQEVITLPSFDNVQRDGIRKTLHS